MRIILIVGLILIFGKTFSQEQKVSVSFEQSNRTQVLEQIQALTGYQFYYVQDWLGDDLISGSYTDTSVKEILNEVFKETVINFYVLDKNKIVLTRNNRIYDELPEGFFGKSKEENAIAEDENESNPVFYKNEKKKKKTKIETVRIGKEDIRNRKKRYTLTGYVKNMRTGEPIADLPIIVKRKNTGVQTNKNGYYEIELSPGLNILETKSLGMEDVQKRIIIYNDGRFDFDLDESLEMLDVIVLESDFDKNVKDANTGTEKIDVEESKNIPLVLGERDVLKVATTLPGISTAGEGSTGFNVRGGKSDQNLILLDDAVIYNPQHFFGVFSAINSFTLGDVDIYKGSIPAEYGGRLSSVLI